MKFSPVSEQEAQKSKSKFQPFPPGQYDFEIVEATDETSKAGNEMIHLNIKLWRGEEFRWVHDYLMPSLEYKLRHFAYAVGMGIKYEAGTLCADDCTGKSGKVAVRIKQQQGYEPKNEVVDYVTPENYQDQKEAVGTAVMKQGKSLAPSAGASLSDEDVPFSPGFHPCMI